MVKIIDGEIVQDDDPRAIEWERRQRQNYGWNDPRLRGSQAPPSQNNQFPPGGGHQGQIQGQSPFQGINEKLAQFGLRPWRIGENVVEPVFTVALILALVFYGLPGVVIVAVIWYMFGRNQRQI